MVWGCFGVISVDIEGIHVVYMMVLEVCDVGTC